MRKLMLFFTALMLTLGVKAQEGSTVAERGAAKGYYSFAAEVTEMVKITSLDQLEDNMPIMIKHSHDGVSGVDHEGHYLTIYSLPTYGAAHIVFMQNKPVGVGVWTTAVVNATEGTYKLKSEHMMVKGGDAKCYLGILGEGNSTGAVLKTTGMDGYEGIYKFVVAADGSGRWNLQCTNSKNQKYLAVVQKDGTATIVEESGVTTQTYFDIYRVVTKSEAQVKYVEASVRLTGQGGNTIVGTHQGWNDFYEFYMSGDAYGCNVSNVYYNEETNTITGDIDFPFPVTGNYLQVPVYLHPQENTNNRLAVVGGKLTTLIGETGDNNQNSQWYIKPRIVGLAITYALYNIGAKKYVSFNENSRSTDIGLSDSPSYFKLNGDDSWFRFQYLYTSGVNTYGQPYETWYNLTGTTAISGSYTGANGNQKYVVSTVTSDNTDLGITQKFPQGMSFWNGGIVLAGEQPDAFNAYWTGDGHEFNSASTSHEVYCAETAIVVNSRSNVTVTFNWNNGDHKLTIFGVDLLNDKGVNILNDYHLGYAGDPNFNNVYTLENVPAGGHILRYYVCHTPEMAGETGHNLNNTTGTITVDGATFRFKYSDAPQNGNWADNTTWYYMLLKDGYGHVCAEPAYTDWNNNLKLNNGTASSSSAALWCIVGDAENGYKFYNRAWGPEYAMTTTGSDGSARTFMTTAAEATTYDILQHETDKNIYVKVRGEVTGNYLNKNGDYLGTWTSGASYGDSGSRVYFNEVHDVTPFDAGMEAAINNIKKEWAPWTANSEIDEDLQQTRDFRGWVAARKGLAKLLDGKVFKFVNKAEEGDARQGRVLRVDENNNMAGVVSQGETIDDFLQIVDNGNGTFKLLHLATNKYFQSPSAHTITENAEDAAVYSYKVYGNEEQALCFVSGNEMMHLGNWGYGYTTINNNDIASGASRWDVICDAGAQSLNNLIAEAKALYVKKQEAAYQANVGVPGYANKEIIDALNKTINGGLAGKTLADATTALTEAMEGVTAAEKAVFFPTNCYFTITNRTHSLVYAKNDVIDETHNAEFIWTTTSVDATNLNHLWGFYQDEATGDYYLYNVGKKQFANSKGKGGYGDTWILSNNPVAITMEAMDDTPYFHIKGDGKTMSVSEGHVGPVITYYADGDQGVPMQFNKSTKTVNNELLEELESMGTVGFAPGFYTLKYNNLYLNDTRMGGAGTAGDGRRTLTAMTADKIDNIFYYTPNKEMVGYKSGYGFTYGYCNTGKPETGYNTFTFETSSEPGKYLIHSATGGSPLGWGDRYLLVGNDNNFTDADAGNKKLAAAWTIEEVTELPVKLTHASKNRGAYGTIYSPVALELVDGVRAYTGYVTTEDGENVLVLEEFTGVVPANTGAVLWQPEAKDNVVVNLPITDEAGSVSEDNKLVGWVFTQVNPDMTGAYYSLGKKDDLMAFYNYTGANLSGFRARIAKNEQMMATKSLRMRFQEATAIEEIISILQNNEVYDLNGRRVMTPAKGLYIVNGKKVFIK